MRKMIIKKTSILILLLLSSVVFQQCKVVKTLKAIYSENVKYTDYSNGQKYIRFIEMHHFGKKVFYEEVKNLVLEAKEKGYVLFYEGMHLNEAKDLEKRKIRKLMGFLPSAESYEEITANTFDKEKFMVQNDSLFLNLVNDKDFNVDMRAKDLIAAFEQKYDKIELNETDLNSPIDKKIEPAYSTAQVKTVIIDFRNLNLVENIVNSQYKKIIILYGANHKKGVFKELRIKDKNWKKHKKGLYKD